jgi:type I restriction enzyme, S subunit
VSDVNKVADLLTDNLDIWTSAIERRSTAGRGRSKKFSLYGIEKLRALILELASAGKLIPNLYGQKDGRLDDVGTWVGGHGFPKRYQGRDQGEVAFLKVSDMNLEGNERSIFFSNNWVTLREAEAMRARVHPIGTIIFPKIGGAIATNKRRILAIHAAIDNNCAGQIPNIGTNVDWLYLVLSSVDMAQYQAGTSVPALNMRKLAAHPIVIPRLDDQIRIVAKVDELMALCDRLEAGAYDAIAAHQLLVKELLSTLTASKNAEDFAESWKRIESHFDTLFTTEDSIDQLKQTILQLAVMGKLVPQDANDEPASKQLDRIVRRRSEDVAEGKQKNSRYKDASNLTASGFDIPSSWVWTTLGELATKITDGAHHTPSYRESGVPFLSVKDMSDGKLSFTDSKFISPEEHALLFQRCNPEFGDLLITKVGTTGVPVIVDTHEDFSLFVSVALVKAQWDLTDVNYLYHLVASPFVKKQSAEGTQGIGNKNLVLKTLSAFSVPLPPLDEQRRIARKIENLFAMCNTLKEHLLKSQNQQVQFADAVASRAVA